MQPASTLPPIFMSITIQRNRCDELASKVASMTDQSADQVWEATLDLLERKDPIADTEFPVPEAKELYEAAVALRTAEQDVLKKYLQKYAVSPDPSAYRVGPLDGPSVCLWDVAAMWGTPQLDGVLDRIGRAIGGVILEAVKTAQRDKIEITGLDIRWTNIPDPVNNPDGRVGKYTVVLNGTMKKEAE